MAFYCNGKKDMCSCDILCADCEHYDNTGGAKITTNADHIRSMSDDDLASWFCNSVTMECCYDTCPARHICSGDDNGMLKWLKQPFEGE